MVRLVFRPYTRLRRSICTSESLRTSTRVSPGFVLAGHRSPSFGSQHVRSGCACPDAGKPAPFANAPGMRRRDNRSHQATDLPSASTEASLCFHCALVFGGTETRAHVRLLGPCFKTGQADHACFRLQYMNSAKILSPTTSAYHTLRLLVHAQHTPCS